MPFLSVSSYTGFLIGETGEHWDLVSNGTNATTVIAYDIEYQCNYFLVGSGYLQYWTKHCCCCFAVDCIIWMCLFWSTWSNFVSLETFVHPASVFSYLHATLILFAFAVYSWFFTVITCVVFCMPFMTVFIYVSHPGCSALGHAQLVCTGTVPMQTIAALGLSQCRPLTGPVWEI